MLNSCLCYSQVIALVDFMYRGEVSIEEEKLEPLMRAAQTLQIHGLSACLRACLQRSGKIEETQVHMSSVLRVEKCAFTKPAHFPNGWPFVSHHFDRAKQSLCLT